MEGEMMITMMTMNGRTTTTTTTFHEKDHSFSTLISTPTWKLYENPSYTCPNPQTHNQNHEKKQQELQNQVDHNKNQLHLLHLPVSNRKLASSFWDLTFIKPLMDSELDAARAQIKELKSQLDHERKARKKAESVNKKLMKELKGRESLEKACEELSAEITYNRAELTRLKKDMEEERKMMRVAEVLREERVQMKLTDAKIMLEEKLSELETTKGIHNGDEDKNKINKSIVVRENRNFIFGNSVKLEAENPHIKRGIRGFVEFPRVVKAIGAKGRHLGTKLECQKAQLMILLKQKTQIQSTNLIMG
ncbi:hypothetical protein LXL04_005717 [Taraxacum kok-saghyz]